jgi:glucan 1,6-alpha-glucosidase
MLATMLHGMQGTPYIFQGEELGMTNIKLPLEKYVDVEIHNLFRDRTAEGYSPEAVMESIWKRGRDNARTPMQWTAGENAGFTTGEPWLTVNPNYTEINAEAALADENSVFYHYQKLIAIRKSYDVIRDGSFTLLCPEDEVIFAYTRDTDNAHMLVVCNFTDQAQNFAIPEAFKGAKCLISNYSDTADCLRPYEAMMLYYEA